MNDVCMNQGDSKESWNELKKECKFEIQEVMHAQYKYKGDNRYLAFHERLCRFNQNDINGIIESAFWQADKNTFKKNFLQY